MNIVDKIVIAMGNWNLITAIINFLLIKNFVPDCWIIRIWLLWVFIEAFYTYFMNIIWGT